MTGGSSRLVPVQGAAVGLLLVPGFVTLLPPESESPIEGIEGQPGLPATDKPGDNNPGGNGPGSGSEHPGGGGNGGPGNGPGNGGPGGGGPGGVPAGPGAPGGTPSGTEGLALPG